MDNTELTAELIALKARVATLDGQGLIDPSLAVVADLQRKISGAKTDTKQTTLLIQQKLNDIKKMLDALQLLVNQHLGVS